MSFRIGQKVVCVDLIHDLRGHPQPLTIGKIYLIDNIMTCRCGLVLVDVGAISTALATRCLCEHLHYGPWWIVTEKFRPLDDLTASLALSESERLIEERPEHAPVPQTA